MFEWFSILVSKFGREVALLIGVLYGGYKFRRIKSICGTIIAGIGTVATFGALVAGAIVLGMASGWFSVDVGQMLTDIATGAGGAWDLVGKAVVDWITTEVA